MEQYPIPTTVGEFVEWLDEYGGWKQQGRYNIKNHVWNDEITHEVIAPDRKSFGQVFLRIKRDASMMGNFWVTVEQYGSDVVLSPYLVEYRDSLIAAIREKWPQGDEQGGWTPRSEADKWLIYQFFEVHKGKRKSATFVDDWLRIRIEKDGLTDNLAHPADNVRQVIYKERKRRKK